MNLATSKSGEIILVTGASRSGKSEWAEILAQRNGKSVIYIATAIVDPADTEWQVRIAKHQQRRPSNWQTKLETRELALTINNAQAAECLLIDSVGTWVANLLDLESDLWQQVSDDLLTSLSTTDADLILVGEETGWGVVPAYPTGRIFRDRLGHLLRQIGTIADTTYLVTGGHVLNLSILGEPLSNYKL